MGKIYNEYEFGDGWLPLVENAKTIIAKYNKEHPDLVPPLEFTQIKEKWGGLRLYLNMYFPDIEYQIHELEDKSYDICEHCGCDKNVKTEWTHGWVMTLCDDCRKKEIEEFNKQFK